MDTTRHSITSKQLLIFIITSEIGSGIITLPNQLAETTGHDGWISVIISGIVTSFFLLIIGLLLKRYSDKSIIDINPLLYGKWLGGTFNLLILLYTYFSASIILRRYSDIVTMKVLPSTPPIITSFFTILPTLYLVWYGLKSVCKLGTEIFFILFFVLLIYAIALNNATFSFLLPIGEAGPRKIIKSCTSSIFCYIGYELIIFIYPNITDKKNAIKYSQLANLLTSLFYLITVLTLTAFFGENMLKNLTTSLMQLSRSISIPLLERIDLIFIVIWLPLVSCVARNFIFCTYHSLNNLFVIKKKKSLLVFLVFSIILLSRTPNNLAETEKYANILDVIFTFFNIFLIISFFISFLNKNGTQENSECND